MPDFPAWARELRDAAHALDAAGTAEGGEPLDAALTLADHLLRNVQLKLAAARHTMWIERIDRAQVQRLAPQAPPRERRPRAVGSNKTRVGARKSVFSQLMED